MAGDLSRHQSATAQQTDADCLIDIPARDGHYVVVTHISGGYDDRAITRVVRAESPVGTPKWRYPIHGADGVVTELIYGSGQAVRLVLPGGGAGKTGYLNCTYHYATEREADA